MIGVTETLVYKCPYCGETQTTALAIYSKYYHVLSLPVLPFDKETTAECTACMATRREMQLDPALNKLAKDVQKRIRHPYSLYLLVIVFGLLLLTAILLL